MRTYLLPVNSIKNLMEGVPLCCALLSLEEPGFYLAFTSWWRNPEWPKAKSFDRGIRGYAPRRFFEMNMR